MNNANNLTESYEQSYKQDKCLKINELTKL